MAWLSNIGMGFRTLFPRRRGEHDLDEELDNFAEAARVDPLTALRCE